MITSNKELASNALKILWPIQTSWLTQESFGLKPEWVLLRSLLFIISSNTAPKISFSRPLQHTVAGRQGSSYWQFVYYWNNVTLFPAIRRSSKFKQLRNIIRSGFMIEGKLSFNIFTKAPSWPWTLFESKNWIVFNMFS